MQLRCSRDWNDPRLLGQQPCQRDLSRRRLLPFSNSAKQINQCLIRLERLRREARQHAAEVGTVEGRFLVYLPREKPLAQRTVGNEADAEFFEGRYHFLLRGSRPQRVFALKRRDRLDAMCATDRLHACFRKAEVLHLACLNQPFHCPRHVFDRHVRVNAVLIEQINGINLETLERGLGHLFDAFWPTIQALPTGTSVRIKFEPELRCYHHSPAERSESFAHKFFVSERAVNFSGIEESDAAFHGCPKQRRHLLLVFGWTVGKTHAHAAQPDSRDFQITVSKFALLHIQILFVLYWLPFILFVA